MTRVMTHVGNFRQSPRWLADFKGRNRTLVAPAKLNADLFAGQLGVAVVLTANSAAADTELDVTALTQGYGSVDVVLAAGGVVIPAGTVLDFGGGKFARLTADAHDGDTTIAVTAIPTAMVIGDRAIYNSSGVKVIPSGTLVGRTLVERDAGTAYGPADVATPDDQIFLTLYDVFAYGSGNVDVELLDHYARVKENYLPDWTGSSAGYKAVVRARYRCILGVD